MKVRNLVLVALFAALTAVGAFLKFSIPVSPVPITLQTLFCILAGALLGSRLGALSQIVYLAIGLVGFPIFTNGGGIAYVLQPTFGYLLGLVPGAFLCGLIVEKAGKATFLRALIASAVGAASLYVIGLPYLYFVLRGISPDKVTSLTKLFSMGFIPFLVGDAFKCIAAGLLITRLRPLLVKRAEVR